MSPVPAIVVDTREQRPWSFADGVDVVRGTLATGDYSLLGHENEVAIERKSLEDFVGCVTRERERFEREIERLSALSLGVIVIEADIGDVWARRYRSQVAPASVVGSACAWTASGVACLFAGSREHAADFALRLLRTWFTRRTPVAA